MHVLIIKLVSITTDTSSSDQFSYVKTILPFQSYLLTTWSFLNQFHGQRWSIFNMSWVLWKKLYLICARSLEM